MAVLDWDALVAGTECPFDEPRVEPSEYWDTVTQLSVSTLCLHKNQTYRGLCLLIFDPRHAVRPDELTLDEWRSFSSDAHRAAEALMAVCKPDHVNMALLGNEIPHLHWHVIPRYKTDPRWGGPIWTTTREEFHDARLPESERTELIAGLRSVLAG